MLSGRGLCDEPITRPEESYRLCCVVVCDLETSRIGAPYIYNVRLLRVNRCDKFKYLKINVIVTLKEVEARPLRPSGTAKDSKIFSEMHL